MQAKYDYKTIVMMEKENHYTMAEFAKLYSVTEDEFIQKVRKKIGKNAEGLLRKIRNNGNIKRRHAKKKVEKNVEAIELKNEVPEVTATTELNVDALQQNTVIEVPQVVIAGTLQTNVTAKNNEEEIRIAVELLEEQKKKLQDECYVLEIDKRKFMDKNTNLQGKLVEAKQRFEAIKIQLQKEKENVVDIISKLRNNRSEIAITNDMLRTSQNELKVILEELDKLSVVRIACGALQMDGFEDESSFGEIDEARCKAKVMELYEKNVFDAMSMRQFKIVAKYMVLQEIVYEQTNRLVELYFSEGDTEIAEALKTLNISVQIV